MLDDGAATLEMELPASLLAELQKSGGLGLNLPGAAGGPSASASDPFAGMDGAATSPGEPKTVNHAFASDPTVERTLRTEPDAVIAPEPDVRAVWRMKLRSGLVLTFPTLDLVRGWAKDKPADQISIARGSSAFFPYADFLKALNVSETPSQALDRLASGEELPQAASMPHPDDGAADPGYEIRTAAAEAAAARRTSGKELRPTQLNFRVSAVGPEESNPWPLRIVLLVILAGLIGGGIYLAMSGDLF